MSETKTTPTANELIQNLSLVHSLAVKSFTLKDHNHAESQPPGKDKTERIWGAYHEEGQLAAHIAIDLDESQGTPQDLPLKVSSGGQVLPVVYHAKSFAIK